jgi:hypothetical protein
VADAVPHVAARRLGGLGRGRVGHRADRHRPPRAGAVVVERLAVRDRQHPRARVLDPRARIRAQRGHEGLLEAVVGGVAPDGGDEEPPHGLAVGVQEALERGRRHGRETPRRGGL